MLSFDQIVLTKGACKLLEQLADKFLPDYRDNADAEELVRHNFAAKTMTAVPGSEYLYALVIKDRGRDYLAYLKKCRSSDRKNRRHDWYVAIVSTCAGALLSDPLWTLLRWGYERLFS